MKTTVLFRMMVLVAMVVAGIANTELKAQDILLEDRSIEYVIRVDVTPDYVEVVGYNGGDYLRFRVRDDGSVYEK